MRRSESRYPSDGTSGQGDVLATWAVWVVLLGVMAVTYARLDPAELYNVSGDGLAGAMSRVLVELNYPIALVAIGIVLLALDGLAARWWLVGSVAVALCAVTAWPGVVDDTDLDARPVNAIPAVGVVLALVLTAVAVDKSGRSLAPRRPLDRGRLMVAAVMLALSVPWLAADLGFHVPEGVFIAERPVPRPDGTVLPAVHLGHHHGLDGALLAISALLLSRPRLRSPTLATLAGLYSSLMFAYGLVNAGQDFWNEQLQKRGWIDRSIPSAVEPSLSLIWLVILALSAATYLVIRWESTRIGQHPPARRVAIPI
ncbi:MAG: hypothetical protein OEV40_06780 [Acidimicrobiia bacterium]|nr:hypothetical protein [Acidimicrobiia bacterium]